MGNQSTAIPSSDVGAVHMVLDSRDGGRTCFYSEVDEVDARKKNIIENILVGRYLHPIRVIAFDLTRGWARDVTPEVAAAVLNCARTEHRKLSQSAELFIEKILGQNASMRAR